MEAVIFVGIHGMLKANPDENSDLGVQHSVFTTIGRFVVADWPATV